jgi:hypothetical protein
VRKVLIPLKSEPDCPGLLFRSDTCAHCSNTGQLSSRCLFLNRVAVRRHIAASQQCFKQVQSQAGLLQNPNGCLARRLHGWSGWLRRAGASDQVKPRENFQFSFLWEKVKSEPDSEVPGLRFGSDTRGHRDCLNLNTGQLELSSRCLFLNQLAVRSHIAAPQLFFNASAKLGYHKIQMEAQPGDGMTGAGGGAGQALDVQHQPPGETFSRVYYTNTILDTSNIPRC